MSIFYYYYYFFITYMLDGQDESKHEIDDRICFNSRKSRSCEPNVFFFNYIIDRYNIFLFIYKRKRYICMKKKLCI